MNLKLLVISRIFPNNKMPQYGTFVRQEVSGLSKICKLKVVAPVPWFPSIPIQIDKIKKWQIFSEVMKYEKNNDVEIFHPRYLVTPKFGRTFYFLFYLIGIINTVKRVHRVFSFDAILVFYGIPDGIAAVLLAKIMKKPVIVKMLGSDVNVDSKGFLINFIFKRILKHADLIVCVCEKLSREIVDRGNPEEKVITIEKSVNNDIFFPKDKKIQRSRLKLPLDQKIILFVGNLLPIKGCIYLIKALAIINEKSVDFYLYIIGDGPEMVYLKNTAIELKIEQYVKFIGSRPHVEIPDWLNASDLLCLPSLDEGHPNIVLEALACGIPVVASRVGGIPEIIKSAEEGLLVAPKDSLSISNAILNIIENKGCFGRRSNKTVRTWKDVANEMHDEFGKVIGNKIVKENC